MHNLFVLILVVSCISMFFVSKPVKIGILIAAGICIYEYKLPSSIGHAVKILPLLFFVSEYANIWIVLNRYRRSILTCLLGIGCIYIIYSVIVSPHLWDKYACISYSIRNTVGRYFLPFAAFLFFQSTKNVQKVFDISFGAIIVMTAFGITNLMFHHSAYVDWLFEGRQVVDYLEEAGGKFEDAARFRVQATFHNPFDYGYTCIICLLFFLYGYLKKYVSVQKFGIVVLCSLFGVVSCNCRSVHLCFILSVLLFMFIYFNSLAFFKYISLVFVVGVIAFSFVPFLNELLIQTLTVFERSSNVSGSSLDMRISQLIAVLYYINGQELFGRGVGFFAYDIGWSEGKSNTKGTDLFGLEGSYLQTLLETGIVGTVLYFTIIGIIIYWAWSKRIENRVDASFLFSIFCLFLLFGVMTGELRTAYLTFLLSGLPFESILNKKSNIIKLIGKD